MSYLDQFGVPGDVSQSLGMSPPFLQSRDEAVSKLAAQRALKWRQRAAGLAEGLQAGLKGNNFGDAFLGGLAGGLQGGEKFATGQWERDFNQNRQNIVDQAAIREADQRAIGLDQGQQKIALDQQTLAENVRNHLATENQKQNPPDKSTPGMENYNFLRGLGLSKQEAMDRSGLSLPKATTMPTEDNSWIGGLVKTTSSGNKFLDVSELTGKDKGVAMRWAVDNKVTAVGTKELASLQDINTARGNIDDMLGQIQSILPKDAQSRIAQYGNIKLSSLMQTNEARAAFGSWRTAAIRNLRATAGTTGLRINQKEIELAVKNDIPQITDTWPVAQRKMENIKSMLGRAERPIVTNDWRDGATTTPTTGAPDVVWKLVNGKLVKE